MSQVLQLILLGLVLIPPIVFIHELGHFIAARLVGITVLEFGIGFPPRLVKLFEQGGTEFTLNWLPIGGFVRPLGEDMIKPADEKSTEKDREAFEKQQAQLEELGKKRVKTKSVMEAGPWQRIFFMAAGAGMNFIGAFLILVIAGMIGRPAPAVVISGVAPTSPADQQQIVFGDVITQINGQAVTSSTQAKTVLEAADANPVKLTILRDDKTLNLTLPVTTNAFNKENVLITSTSDGSPAASVFKQGDVILKIDNVGYETVDGLKKYIDDNAGKVIHITYLRNGEQKTVDVTPRVNPPSGQGALGIEIVQLQYDLAFGVDFGDGYNGIEHAPFGTAITDSFQETGALIKQIVSVPVQLIRGQISLSDARPISPVGMTQIAQQVYQQSVQLGTPYPFLNFAAVISIALGITNLLPIPAFDGGRILFVIIELLRGKPMDPEREGMVHLIGFVLLMGLALILIVNDIIHPISIPGLPK